MPLAILTNTKLLIRHLKRPDFDYRASFWLGGNVWLTEEQECTAYRHRYAGEDLPGEHLNISINKEGKYKDKKGDGTEKWRHQTNQAIAVGYISK